MCRGRVLDSLMKQHEQGSITGIHGRLGDLGTIDEKYDVAISTACPGLDDIVVDTMETAVKCVEFLKKHDLGCATFIALDKVITIYTEDLQCNHLSFILPTMLI